MELNNNNKILDAYLIFGVVGSVPTQSQLVAIGRRRARELGHLAETRLDHMLERASVERQLAFGLDQQVQSFALPARLQVALVGARVLSSQVDYLKIAVAVHTGIMAEFLELFVE